MYRIDINRSEILWRFQTGDIVKSTAVLYNNNLYFGSYDHNFYCISSSVSLLFQFTEARQDKFVLTRELFQDGLLIWKNEIDASPIYTTAIVHQNHIVVATLGGTVALLKHNGVCSTKITVEKPFFSNPTELSHLNAFVSIDVSGIIRLFDIHSLAEVRCALMFSLLQIMNNFMD